MNERMAVLADYPFTRLAQLLAEVAPRANTPPLVLSVGEPQRPPPRLLAETLAAHADRWGAYPPVQGTPDFRRAVAAWLGRRYGLEEGLVDPEHGILPATGTREALFMTALLAVPEAKGGRRPVVLMPNPFYAVYEGAARLAGAEPVFLTASPETGFLPDLDALSEETLSRTALFYLCSPANPQGAAADAAYLRRALDLARRFDFVLAVDECYAEIWDKHPPPGALQAAQAMGGAVPTRHLLVFHSLSKRSSAAGLRSGFVAGDPDLVRRFLRLRNYGVAGNPLPALAAAAALWRDEAHVEETRAFYRANLDLAERHLAGRFGFYRPQGGFFLWLDVGDGVAATVTLWREGALRVLPGAYLTRPGPGSEEAGDRFIRVALVHPPDAMERALSTLARVLDGVAA